MCFWMSKTHDILFTAALEQLPEGIMLVDKNDRIFFARSMSWKPKTRIQPVTQIASLRS